MKAPNYAPVYAAALYPGLTQIFRDHGYALAVHGSVARDFDLVAIKWADQVSSVDTLFEAIRNTYSVSDISEPIIKNHGRIAYNISFCFGDFFIDLSFVN